VTSNRQPCPACPGGWGEYLGRLGSLDWYRCRCCGIDFDGPPPFEDEALCHAAPAGFDPSDDED